MFTNTLLDEIENIYSRGDNIINYINNLDNSEMNSVEAILISYEYQAGSYIDLYNKNTDICHRYAQQIADVMNQLGTFKSIMEAGVGEATNFQYVIKNIQNLEFENCHGFDISWSRLKAARDFLREKEVNGENLFVAELSSIPLHDSSIDVVYTSHSIEPNRGNEERILKELYRVTKKYLVLFEPDYELASDEAKERMDYHRYVKGIRSTLNALGYTIIKHELLEYSINHLNPTSVIIVEKASRPGEISSCNDIYKCPVTGTDLTNCNDIYFSKAAKLMYPVIQGIPCLLSSQAILGCKYES